MPIGQGDDDDDDDVEDDGEDGDGEKEEGEEEEEEDEEEDEVAPSRGFARAKNSIAVTKKRSSQGEAPVRPLDAGGPPALHCSL